MALFLLLFSTLTTVFASPQLFHFSNQNQCIKNIVQSFVTHNSCKKLSQTLKSELAFKLTNCLFLQMGKPSIACTSLEKCQMTGDSWNTFTTFFAHIDNLCHFYWQLTKSQRTENMIDALVNSAQKTQKTLSKNNQNTQQILQLQNSLKIQMLSSMASQQQMSQIINNSSLAINTLTSQISRSLNKIHQQIDENYQVVSRILSAVNQILKHLDSLSFFLFAEISSIQGVLFFIALVLLILIGCAISQKVRIRKNESLILVSINFLLEFCFSSSIDHVIGMQAMRCLIIILILSLVICANPMKNEVQKAFSAHLNSERMNRLMERALRRQLSQIQIGRKRMRNEQIKD